MELLVVNGVGSAREVREDGRAYLVARCLANLLRCAADIFASVSGDRLSPREPAARRSTNVGSAAMACLSLTDSAALASGDSHRFLTADESFALRSGELTPFTPAEIFSRTSGDASAFFILADCSALASAEAYLRLPASDIFFLTSSLPNATFCAASTRARCSSDRHISFVRADIMARCSDVAHNFLNVSDAAARFSDDCGPLLHPSGLPAVGYALYPNALSQAPKSSIQHCSRARQSPGAHVSTTENQNAASPYLTHADCKCLFACLPARKSVLCCVHLFAIDTAADPTYTLPLVRFWIAYTPVILRDMKSTPSSKEQASSSLKYTGSPGLEVAC